jgi:hypothetical protein
MTRNLTQALACLGLREAPTACRTDSAEARGMFGLQRRGGRPPAFDTQAYEQRHAVEATVHIAAIDIWLGCLERNL